MNIRHLYRTPVALAAALTISAAAFPALAQAAKATSAQPVATAKAGVEGPDLMKLSEDGFMAMRSVRAARVAIFNGDPKAAHDLLATAQKSLQAASKEAPTFRADLQTIENGKVTSNTDMSVQVESIPIDGQIVLVDSFVDSPAKKTHIDKANAHIAAGKGKDAIDELKLAEVDTSFTRVMMPLQATTKRVDDALKLVDQKKYYEANLALKAAEDGLLIDSVTLTEAPKAAAKAAPKAAAGAKSSG
jgi:hypothetical protein